MERWPFNNHQASPPRGGWFVNVEWVGEFHAFSANGASADEVVDRVKRILDQNRINYGHGQVEQECIKQWAARDPQKFMDYGMVLTPAVLPPKPHQIRSKDGWGPPTWDILYMMAVSKSGWEEALDLATMVVNKHNFVNGCDLCYDHWMTRCDQTHPRSIKGVDNRFRWVFDTQNQVRRRQRKAPFELDETRRWAGLKNDKH